jgi:hypothetical protein
MAKLVSTLNSLEFECLSFEKYSYYTILQILSYSEEVMPGC